MTMTDGAKKMTLRLTGDRTTSDTMEEKYDVMAPFKPYWSDTICCEIVGKWGCGYIPWPGPNH
jgi:hypothetical protein